MDKVVDVLHVAVKTKPKQKENVLVVVVAAVVV